MLLPIVLGGLLKQLDSQLAAISDGLTGSFTRCNR
jgi:hypothetical protein